MIYSSHRGDSRGESAGREDAISPISLCNSKKLSRTISKSSSPCSPVRGVIGPCPIPPPLLLKERHGLSSSIKSDAILLQLLAEVGGVSSIPDSG